MNMPAANVDILNDMGSQNRYDTLKVFCNRHMSLSNALLVKKTNACVFDIEYESSIEAHTWGVNVGARVKRFF